MWQLLTQKNNLFLCLTALSITQIIYNLMIGKGKGKVHPRTGHEGPEGE
jgi:hypothetical protein